MSFDHQFKRLVFAVTVYELWKARNAGFFLVKFSNSGNMVCAIIDSVLHVVRACGNAPRTIENYALALEWNLSLELLA